MVPGLKDPERTFPKVIVGEIRRPRKTAVLKKELSSEIKGRLRTPRCTERQGRVGLKRGEGGRSERKWLGRPGTWAKRGLSRGNGGGGDALLQNNAEPADIFLRTGKKKVQRGRSRSATKPAVTQRQ